MTLSSEAQALYDAIYSNALRLRTVCDEVEPNHVVDDVAAAFALTPNELRSHRGCRGARRIMRARVAAALIMRIGLAMTMTEIGAALGVDHSAVCGYLRNTLLNTRLNDEMATRTVAAIDAICELVHCRTPVKPALLTIGGRERISLPVADRQAAVIPVDQIDTILPNGSPDTCVVHWLGGELQCACPTTHILPLLTTHTPSYTPNASKPEPSS